MPIYGLHGDIRAVIFNGVKYTKVMSNGKWLLDGRSFSAGQFIYEINESGEYCIVSPGGGYSSGDVVIPSHFGEVAVVGIEGFGYDENLTSLTLLNSGIVLPDWGLFDCANLTEVRGKYLYANHQTFAYCTSLYSIPVIYGLNTRSFQNCIALTTVTISTTCPYVPRNAFEGCTSLSTIYFLGTEEEWNERYTGGSEEIDNATIVFSHEHSWSEWETLATPDCETEGQRERYCSVCGVREIEPIEEFGHEWSEWEETPATCEADGKKERTCSRCSEVETETIAATGHTWGLWTIVSKPTCTEAGSNRRTCSVCGAFDVDLVDKKGHTWSDWKIVLPAECEIDGQQERTCSVCGDTETEIIKAAGHDWDVEFEVILPTCTSGGYTIRRCNACGIDYKYNFTDPLEHFFIDGVCVNCGYNQKRPVYYGVSGIPESYNSSFILGLAHLEASDSHLKSISVTPLANEYIYYCSPTAFGDCALSYNNWIGGFTLIIEGISVTNADGSTEAYNIYKSNQPNLGVNGEITIKIEKMGG